MKNIIKVTLFSFLLLLCSCGDQIDNALDDFEDYIEVLEEVKSQNLTEAEAKEKMASVAEKAKNADQVLNEAMQKHSMTAEQQKRFIELINKAATVMY